ncbi:MAG: thiamine-phosphate kinase [Enhydrobacter sp.]|nr:MAG: thiamine-phosphate kinase [Enhydrobacter sp.]
MNDGKLILDLGEKEIIRTIIKPLLNPQGTPDLVGDDCAVIKLTDGQALCISTDRVPADLISFRLGLIDYRQLGNYLAVLNLSDVAAMGAMPIGLLLNLGLPATLSVEHFQDLMLGASRACERYDCRVIGGDLSNASELSISATSIGLTKYENVLRRSGSKVGDRIFCTDALGLTSTAFHYFLDAKNRGLRLSSSDEDVLADQFRSPRARFDVGPPLSLFRGVTCMDNTDGIGQTLLELAEINQVGFELNAEALPIHHLTEKVAAYLGMGVLDIALGPGADFQLLGTLPIELEPAIKHPDLSLKVIGRVVDGSGVHVFERGSRREFVVRGWNYFSAGVPRQSSCAPGSNTKA